MTRRKGAPSSGQAKDPLQVFAEKLRDHKGLESRWAVLDENRVEYFRGKDLVSLLKSEPDLSNVLGAPENAENTANLLLKNKLIVRCDRVVKTLRPGKKKLSKWPARLELNQDQRFSQEDAFFAWNFEKSRPLWQTILSFSVPIVTVACCLFPIFPHWCKLLVMYLCLTLFALIMAILIVRCIVFGCMWMLFGKNVWFFPHLLADETSFSKLIKFWPEPPKEDEKRPKWTSRLAVALVTVLVTWLCIRHAPNEAARARYQKRMSNIIDEVLEWSPKLALSGKVEEEHLVANETDIGNMTQQETVEPETD